MRGGCLHASDMQPVPDVCAGRCASRSFVIDAAAGREGCRRMCSHEAMGPTLAFPASPPMRTQACALAHAPSNGHEHRYTHTGSYAYLADEVLGRL